MSSRLDGTILALPTISRPIGHLRFECLVIGRL
jgi:hypothetical protein